MEAQLVNLIESNSGLSAELEVSRQAAKDLKVLAAAALQIQSSTSWLH
jgi:hypothetical protein